MYCGEIIRIIEAQWEPDSACDWDNVGLLVGKKEKQVKKIMLALDATEDVIRQAADLEADMLITHHPMIFRGIKHITSDDFIGRKILSLVRADISYYAMHTNFDVRTMATEAAKRLGLAECQVLEYTGEVEGEVLGIGQVGLLPDVMTLLQCADKVKKDFQLEHVKVFGDMDAAIRKAAISPGSGKSEIKHALRAGADVLITGDIDHHDGIDAVEQGLTIIDAGHYGLEQIFSDYMEDFLNKKLENVIIMKGMEKSPFQVI